MGTWKQLMEELADKDIFQILDDFEKKKQSVDVDQSLQDIADLIHAFMRDYKNAPDTEKVYALLRAINTKIKKIQLVI